MIMMIQMLPLSDATVNLTRVQENTRVLTEKYDFTLLDLSEIKSFVMKCKKKRQEERHNITTHQLWRQAYNQKNVWVQNHKLVIQ